MPTVIVSGLVAILALAALAACDAAPVPISRPPTPSATASAAVTRTLDPTAPLFFEGFTQPAPPGGTATATIRTVPGITCSGVFLWPGMPSGGQQVAPVSADASGTVTLRWAVDPATPPGSWRIDANCGGRVVSTHVPIG